MTLRPTGVPWIGDAPATWEIWQIGHMARVGNGSTPSRSNRAYWAEGTYPWLNSSVVNKPLIDRSTQFVTDAALAECHLPKVAPGSVIVAITGQGKTRGKASILAFEATINQHLAFIKLTHSRLSPEYLQLILTASYGFLREISAANGSTRGALTCGDIRHFKVPVPPPEQQFSLRREIVARTADLDRAIAAAEKEVALIEEFRTRLIADVVTGKLDVRSAATSLPDATEFEPTEILLDDGEAEFDLDQAETEELAA